MEDALKSIVEAFETEGRFVSAAPLGSGHINTSFRVTCDSKRQYVLQRINDQVFGHIPELMDNIVRVTDHIREKYIEQGVGDIDRRVLRVIFTKDGSSFYRDESGGYWRMYAYIENGCSYDTGSDVEIAYRAAGQFGSFTKMLADLPSPPLFETIKDFHDTPKRFARFEEVLESDPCNRSKDAQKEIGFVLEHESIVRELTEIMKAEPMPERTVHNDTKINNVIFDAQTDEALCVVDLDTVMPGLVIYDFGDLVRTAACLAEEDETDLSKVEIDMGLFEHLLRGFLKETTDLLTVREKQMLVFGGKLITFEQMIRFLTDFLQGDPYYRIKHPRHNLERTRNQMQLTQSIIENESQMTKLLRRYSN